MPQPINEFEPHPCALSVCADVVLHATYTHNLRELSLINLRAAPSPDRPAFVVIVVAAIPQTSQPRRNVRTLAVRVRALPP